jgi:hypothetical protein
MRTQKVTKTLAKSLLPLVGESLGVAYIAPAKSNDRVLALVSGYGDGPGASAKFSAFNIETGTVTEVASANYVDINAVCDFSAADPGCDKVNIEAQNARYEEYQADYVPRSGSCGGKQFTGATYFSTVGDTWFVGCEGI